MKTPASRYLSVFLFVTGLMLCLPGSVAGQPLDSEEVLQAGKNWTVGIPFWLPGYRGEFAIGDISVDGESSGGSGFFERLFESKLSLKAKRKTAGWNNDYLARILRI